MQKPPSGRQHLLAAHGQELVVVEVGGGIRSYRAGGTDVVDGYGEAEMCSGGRGQLLAPWPNRLTDGRFEWEGESLQVALTEPAHSNAIHGLVRWSSWTLEEAGRAEARLVHRLHSQPGWPWALHLAVTYRLEPSGMAVTTEITNRSDRPCPAGFGWHPYLAVPGAGPVDGAVLTVPAATAYRADERGRPTGRLPVGGTDLDFTTGRPVGPQRLDTAFTDLDRGPDGRAAVTVAGPGGDRRVRLWLDGSFTHLMVFTGDTLADPLRRRRAVAVEPMTCAPDMLRSGDGRRILEPGATLAGTWGIELPA